MACESQTYTPEARLPVRIVDASLQHTCSPCALQWPVIARSCRLELFVSNVRGVVRKLCKLESVLCPKIARYPGRMVTPLVRVLTPSQGMSEERLCPRSSSLSLNSTIENARARQQALVYPSGLLKIIKRLTVSASALQSKVYLAWLSKVHLAKLPSLSVTFNPTLNNAISTFASAAETEFEHKTKISSKSTVNTRLSKWESDVILPDENVSDLELNSEARKILVEQGPVAFTQMFGSHYIAGYYKAALYGVMVRTTFETREKKIAAKSTLALGVSTLTQQIGIQSCLCTAHACSAVTVA